ncbi:MULTISPECIES: hypothetical protein [unclassified Roseofilum]|uniref:hypothetical protein n=1 Tax=unclassified Roseofilum TaxID=2620099 RepID=UPI001B20C553|nr:MULTISPECIES: hypothetical protein [unclassified Roseofilum]MBP0009430.1 hypothetical protein [Roseofilum sp. Belize Diploria]MBP0034950.1 hypothetical protein [Roseofilum sp. Belize BBD 4]
MCTLMALACSGFGFAVGGNLQFQSKMQACQDYSWVFSKVCQLWAGPNAWLQGSTTGAWVGMVLGSFVAGLATSREHQEDYQQLTAEEEAELKRVLCSLETAMTGVYPFSSREGLILALGMQLSQGESKEGLKLHTVKQLISSLEESNLNSGKGLISGEDNDKLI